MNDMKYITYEEKKSMWRVVVSKRIAGKRKTFQKSFAGDKDSREDLRRIKEIRDQLLSDLNMTPTMMAVKKEETNPDNMLDMTVAQLLPGWYQREVLPRLNSPRSRGWYELILVDHILPYFGQMKIRDVTKDVVQAWATDYQLNGNERQDKILSSSTIRQYISKFRMFWRYLREERGVNVLDPCVRINVKKTKTAKKKIFNDMAKHKLLRQAMELYGPMWATLFQFYFESLCRRSELAGLKWEHVDFQGSRIYIKNTLTVDYQRNVIERDVTKTEESEAWIPISEDIAKKLLRLKAKQKLTDKGFSMKRYVFRDYDTASREWEQYIYPEAISQHFRYACTKAGLKGYTLHGTRKTGYSNLVNSGVDPLVAAKIGRWVNPKVPSKHYYAVDNLTKENVMKEHLFATK
jgi:integrase